MNTKRPSCYSQRVAAVRALVSAATTGYLTANLPNIVFANARCTAALAPPHNAIFTSDHATLSSPS